MFYALAPVPRVPIRPLPSPANPSRHPSPNSTPPQYVYYI